MKNTILYILLAFLITSFVYGQEDQIDKEKRKEILSTLKIADGFFKSRRYYDIARDYYKQVVILDPNNVYATYKLAESYRFLKYYEDAQKWYAKVCMMDEETYPLAKLHYAEMAQAVGKYKMALGLYYQFLSFDGLKESDIHFANLGVESCNFAIEQELLASKNEEHLRMAPLPKSINKLRSEFGFSTYGDQYLYTGTDRIYYKRKIKIPKQQIEAPIKIEYDTVVVNRLFLTERKGDTFTEGEVMDFTLEDRFMHYGSPTFSSDSSSMYLTVGLVDHPKGSFFAVYKTTKNDNGEWKQLEKLKGKINKKKFVTKNPQIVRYQDQDALLFSSNQPGGFGNFDLYIGRFDKKGKVKSILNLGDKINGAYDEVTPFYDAKEGKLYFSSNSKAGFGQLDVFSIQGDFEEGWDNAENMGLPYNSGADDFYYSHTSDGEIYLSSNRSKKNTIDNSTCCFDIYQPSADTLENTDEKKYVLLLNIYDKFTHNEVTETNISIIDSKNNNLLESVNTTPGTKLFVHLKGESDYIIRLENDKYEVKNLRVSTVGKATKDTMKNDVYLKSNLSTEERGWEYILANFGKLTNEDITYSVQIGAYSKSKLAYFENLGISTAIDEVKSNDFYRYLTGSYKVPKEIEALRQEVVTKGVPDAFVVCFLKGERITMKEAVYLLSTVVE